MTNPNKPICCLCQHKIEIDDKWFRGSDVSAYICRSYLPASWEIRTMEVVFKAQKLFYFIIDKSLCYTCYENPPDLNEIIFKMDIGLL